MIIVEGMDNSGKSILCGKLAAMVPGHNVYKLSLLKNPNKSKLKGWLDRTSRINFFDQPHVVDRFSLISELVYGEILRGENCFGTMNNWKILFDYISRRDLHIVYCRPPNNIILHNMGRQMSGVIQNSLILLKRYDEVMGIIKLAINTNGRGSFIRYNWDDEWDNSLQEFIKNYTNQLEK